MATTKLVSSSKQELPLPSPILVTVDTSDESAAQTVRLGADLARANNTKLVIVSCEQDESEQPQADEATLRRAADALNSARIEWGQTRCEDFINCVSDAIANHNPAWVCVPQTVLHKVERILRLSPAKRLVEAVSSPLWIVGSPDRRQPIVLAAIDPGHEHGKTAHLDHLILEYAAWIAQLVGAELHVLHAVFAFDVPQNILAAGQVKRRDQVIELAQAFDVSTSHVHVPISPASQAIEQYAAELDPTVVVMGAVKRSAWRRILVGSTTREIVTKLAYDIVTLMPDAAPLK